MKLDLTLIVELDLTLIVELAAPSGVMSDWADADRAGCLAEWCVAA